ncbi:ATP-dependent protease HslVU (ClpYQ) peptidase subunit [Chitinivorax tropicus]|uniref:ATP-dependent protease HslVU (ClpYQ) peptidase subunit n=1 Tax=Chitinivorax tropicus TaxID=714531 RepID=A0A840MNZ9_9PROT|nr:ATP-dependent protease HslVU (ClpYQ) peptidase subunit [Chitinivorax tropicus]
MSVIAGDSQSTFGDTRLAAAFDSASNKIFQVGENHIGISGSAAHDLVLQSALRKRKKLDLSNRVAIFDTFRQLHPVLKEEFFLKPDEEEDDPYESSQMTVLIANPHGIFGVYSMREVYQFERFWAIGSGREYAIGAMHALYDQLDAEAIARSGVEAGCTFDINSALPLTLYSATSKVA